MGMDYGWLLISAGNRDGGVVRSVHTRTRTRHPYMATLEAWVKRLKRRLIFHWHDWSIASLCNWRKKDLGMLTLQQSFGTYIHTLELTPRPCCSIQMPCPCFAYISALPTEVCYWKRVDVFVMKACLNASSFFLPHPHPILQATFLPTTPTPPLNACATLGSDRWF